MEILQRKPYRILFLILRTFLSGSHALKVNLFLSGRLQSLNNTSGDKFADLVSVHLQEPLPVRTNNGLHDVRLQTSTTSRRDLQCEHCRHQREIHSLLLAGGQREQRHLQVRGELRECRGRVLGHRGLPDWSSLRDGESDLLPGLDRPGDIRLLPLSQRACSVSVHFAPLLLHHRLRSRCRSGVCLPFRGGQHLHYRLHQNRWRSDCLVCHCPGRPGQTQQ